MLNDLERRFGKYAIPHLMNYIIGGYVIGYILMMTAPRAIQFLTLEPHYVIHNLQIWRIITWVLIPPNQNLFFALIMMVLYWQLGNVLEQSWGTFRFNLYIFGGLFFTVAGAFIMYGIFYGIAGIPVAASSYITTDYINMSIFLAFAVTYPDMQVLLYFIIPIKMKWMALFYGVLTLYSFIMSDVGGRIAIFASLLNFLIFYISTKNQKPVSHGAFSRGQFKQHQGFRTKTSGESVNVRSFRGKTNIARHKCAICGRTDISNPELEFRFCSKCNGNYEYCNDHLFTHTHII